MAKGIYVGVTEEETLIAFTSNPVPTAWDGTSLTSDTATNDYGIWKITASSTNVNAVENAFDNSTSTVWQSGSSASVNYVTLNCPTDITIKPTEISIKYKNFANLSAIEGQRSSGEWINLATLERKTSETTTTFNIDTGEYYKAIRIVANQINSSYAYQYLYDFKINSGTIKKAGKTNIARKVKKLYIGVDGKARKIKKGYIGVNGVARLFYNYIEPQTITSFSTPNFTSAKYTDEFGSEWTLSPATAYAAWDKNGDTYFSGSASSTVRLTLTLPDGYYLTPKKFYYQMRYCDWTLYGVTADGTEYSIATGGNGGTGMVNSSTDISFSNQREYVKFYLDISSYNGSNIPQMWMAYFGSSILRIG
jgi:hypothetical protein